MPTSSRLQSSKAPVQGELLHNKLRAEVLQLLAIVGGGSASGPKESASRPDPVSTPQSHPTEPPSTPPTASRSEPSPAPPQPPQAPPPQPPPQAPPPSQPSPPIQQETTRPSWSPPRPAKNELRVAFDASPAALCLPFHDDDDPLPHDIARDIAASLRPPSAKGVICSHTALPPIPSPSSAPQPPPPPHREHAGAMWWEESAPIADTLPLDSPALAPSPCTLEGGLDALRHTLQGMGRVPRTYPTLVGHPSTIHPPRGAPWHVPGYWTQSELPVPPAFPSFPHGTRKGGRLSPPPPTREGTV
eukprot:Sspe_Gene.99661::Locus_73379_Transcript_1_1_Confidence_1.000_Length_2417::g.99661::m.99661